MSGSRNRLDRVLEWLANALAAIGYDGPARPEPFNKAVNALENDPACAACSEAMHRAMALIKA